MVNGLFEPIPDKLILDLVTFENVLITYNKNYHVYVRFNLDPQLKGSTLDWIGIFKAGWNTFESFLAFEWGIGEPIDETGRKRNIIFNSRYLKEALQDTNYQFVYISKNLQILGVSQFFQFVGDDNNNYCLNATFFTSALNNSKAQSVDPDECLELVRESIQPGKRSRPICSINVPKNWEQVYTSCWKCKSFFEMINKHNELLTTLKECTEQNEQLKERLSRLETVLENVWIPKTLLEPWDVNKEKSNFQQFVSVMTTPSSSKGDEKGDHSCGQRSLVPVNDTEPPRCDYCIDEDSSKLLFLKAIIRRQEDVIRKLSKEMQLLILTRLPRVLPKATDIVTLVRAKEKETAEIIDLENPEPNSDNNCSQSKVVLDSAEGDKPIDEKEGEPAIN